MADPTPIGDILEDNTSESLKNNQTQEKPCGYEGCEGIIPSGDYKCTTCGKAPLGGRRPGAGFPQGEKRKKTLEAMKVKEAFNQRIMKHADRLFNAQLSLAVGEQVLMVKYTTGEGKNKATHYDQVTDPETIKDFLDEADGMPTNLYDEEHFYYISTKPANNQALDSLINRALGKVPEKLEISDGFFSQDTLQIEIIGEDIDDDIAGDRSADDDSASGEEDSSAEPSTTPSP